MPLVATEFPHVIAVEELTEVGAVNLNINKPLIDQIEQAAYRGVVTLDGKWALDTTGQQLAPAGDWKIEKLDVGVYKINHGLGYNNTSLNASLLQSPGSLQILEHTPLYFTVQTTLNGVVTDMPFMFTLIQVIAR